MFFTGHVQKLEGFPTKRVKGKLAPQPGGHVWVDVFVPINGAEKYGLLAVDPTRPACFGKLKKDHLFGEVIPPFRKRWPWGRFWDKIRGKEYDDKLELTIERI